MNENQEENNAEIHKSKIEIIPENVLKDPESVPEVTNSKNSSEVNQNENIIEYIYEESSEEESSLGQGTKSTRKGRKIKKPSRFDEYV